MRPLPDHCEKTPSVVPGLKQGFRQRGAWAAGSGSISTDFTCFTTLSELRITNSSLKHLKRVFNLENKMAAEEAPTLTEELKLPGSPLQRSPLTNSRRVTPKTLREILSQN